MDENASKGLHLGTGLIITVLVISIGITFLFRWKAVLNLFSKNIDQVTYSVSKSNFTKYDNTTVSGSDVISAISLYATDKFTISVKTTQDSTGIIYNSPTGYKIQDSANSDFIEPTAKFKSQIVKNANQAVTQLVFSPNSGQYNGNMTNNIGKGIVITPGTQDQAVPEGYTDGNLNSEKVLGDPNLIPENIVAGKSIFGINGNAPMTVGKRWTNGKITLPASPTQMNLNTISGLPFTPSIIMLRSSVSYSYQMVYVKGPTPLLTFTETTQLNASGFSQNANPGIYNLKVYTNYFTFENCFNKTPADYEWFAIE